MKTVHHFYKNYNMLVEQWFSKPKLYTFFFKTLPFTKIYDKKIFLRKIPFCY